MKSFLVWTGGIGLLFVAAIDTLAMIGRHAGFRLLGSIELIQPAVLVAGAIAIVFGTLVDAHARVRLVYDRLNSAWRWMADFCSELAMLAMLSIILVGSVWLMLDLWPSSEISEIVGVPWRWMRLAANLALGATIAITALRLFRWGKTS
ncbi:TRAP transporter small permease subunit [Pelagerythrobacter marensis]|uniref:TRAP transporter small permease protein n=1 Tax=Pelagerythrobacter marensis TaxID=543877 RepID=A0ABZ2D387_9SPHN